MAEKLVGIKRISLSMVFTLLIINTAYATEAGNVNFDKQVVIGNQALALNGQPMGIFEGADFAAAIFSLWLGEKPFDGRFKNDLLGLNRKRCDGKDIV